MATGLLLALLIGCADPPRRRSKPRPKPAAEARPEAAPLVAQPLPSGMTTGTVRAVEVGTLFLEDGRRFPLAGRSLADRCSPGDAVMLTLRAGLVVIIERFQKQGGGRRETPPEPPEVGEFVTIDLIQGEVTKVDLPTVTLNVFDGDRFIGETDLILRATTVLHRSARPAAARRELDEPLVAEGLPRTGPLAELPVLAAGALPAGLSAEVVAAVQTSDRVRISLLLENQSGAPLRGGQLILELKLVGESFSFGALRLLDGEPPLAPGESRRLNLEAETPFGPARGARVKLAELALGD